MTSHRSVVGLALALTSACSSQPIGQSAPNTAVVSAGSPSATAPSGAGNTASSAGTTAGARAVSSGAAGSAGVQPPASGGAGAATAGVPGEPPATAGAAGVAAPIQAGAGGQQAAAGASGIASNNAGSGASAASGAPGDCAALDPLAVLRSYAPKDEEAAADFEGYLTDELGSLTCATRGSGGARTITQTIFVPPNSVYDGQGEKLTADAAAMRCDTSEGEQAESQRPYFVLAPGATLKNVTISYPGCEGVHMLGDNTLDHVLWEDAGEDAASVRSYFPGGKITITHSEGHKAADKMFQFNAPCDVKIENFKGSDMGKLVRQNGGKDFPLMIDLNTVNITGIISAVVQSDSPQCFVRHHALEYMFTGSGDKADRVFRDIPAGNITAY